MYANEAEGRGDSYIAFSSEQIRSANAVEIASLVDSKMPTDVADEAFFDEVNEEKMRGPSP